MAFGKDTVVERCAKLSVSPFKSIREQAGTEFLSTALSPAIANLPKIAMTNDGHNAVIWNAGAKIFIIDPAGEETIDGAQNLALGKDEWRLVRSKHTGWSSVAAGRRSGANTGKVTQIIHRKMDDFASGESNHLRDDTRPFATDMDPVPGLFQTITPTGPGELHVHVTLQVSNSASGWVLGGLFVDDDAQACAVAEGYITTGTDDQTLSFWYMMSIMDAAPTTFNIRMATSNGTWYLNGSTGSHRLFGGAWYSSLEIIETAA